MSVLELHINGVCILSSSFPQHHVSERLFHRVRGSSSVFLSTAVYSFARLPDCFQFLTLRETSALRILGPACGSLVHTFLLVTHLQLKLSAHRVSIFYSFIEVCFFRICTFREIAAKLLPKVVLLLCIATSHVCVAVAPHLTNTCPQTSSFRLLLPPSLFSFLSCLNLYFLSTFPRDSEALGGRSQSLLRIKITW